MYRINQQEREKLSELLKPFVMFKDILDGNKNIVALSTEALDLLDTNITELRYFVDNVVKNKNLENGVAEKKESKENFLKKLKPWEPILTEEQKEKEIELPAKPYVFFKAVAKTTVMSKPKEEEIFEPGAPEGPPLDIRNS